MTRLCCLIRKVKMTKILVVGLAVILAAAGSGRADSTNGQGSTSSATSGSAGSSGSAHSSGGAAAHSSGSGAVVSARSSGSGSVQQGAVAPRSGAVPVVRQNPTNVNVQNRVPANVNPNWRVPRPLDRSELLARQSPYHRNWLNLATIQGITQSTANTGQVRRGGQVSDDTNLRMRRGRDAQNSPDRIATNGVKTTTPNTPMQATNSGLRTGKPVLNFNNSNTMNFADACRRHRDHHDRDWW